MHAERNHNVYGTNIHNMISFRSIWQNFFVTTFFMSEHHKMFYVKQYDSNFQDANQYFETHTSRLK